MCLVAAIPSLFNRGESIIEWENIVGREGGVCLEIIGLVQINQIDMSNFKLLAKIDFEMI